MSTVTIEYIWQAILDSERSDEIQLSDNEFLIKAAAARLAMRRRVQSGTATTNPSAGAAISPAPDR